MKKLIPDQIRQILACSDSHLPYRMLEQQIGISRASIGRIFVAAALTGKSAIELLQLSDNELLEAIYPQTRSKYAEPDWQWIHSQLHRKGVTLQLLYEQFKLNSCHDVYSYTSFCRSYTRWKVENGVRRAGGNVERIPGERMEIDFAGDTIEWVDSNAVVHHAKLFVATLPYSCLFFTEAFDDETQTSWIYGIVDALEYFEGAPQVLVMDNAKALVKTANWQEGEIQYSIRSLCSYYGMQPWACKPRSPKQKNRVEAAVNDVERWIIAQMNLNHAVLANDLADLNKQIRRRVDELNNKPFRASGTTASRRSRYEELEKASMQPLPRLPYEPGIWKLLVADKAHCVRIASDGNHRYSVPAEYIGQKVAVRICRTTLKTYDPNNMQSLGVHTRHTGLKGPKTHILDQHLTPEEKHYRRTSQDWIDVFTKRGLTEKLAVEFVSYLSDKKGNFPSGRMCGAVLSLFRSFAPSVIRQAVATALEDDLVNYKFIRQLCEQIEFADRNNAKLDFGKTNTAPRKIVVHENIRGNYE